MPEKTQQIRGMSLEDFELFTDRVEKEFESIFSNVADRKYRKVTEMPQDDEYEDLESVLLIDEMGQVDNTNRGALYIFVKYRNRWYRTAALTAAR